MVYCIESRPREGQRGATWRKPAECLTGVPVALSCDSVKYCPAGRLLRDAQPRGCCGLAAWSRLPGCLGAGSREESRFQQQPHRTVGPPVPLLQVLGMAGTFQKAWLPGAS